MGTGRQMGQVDGCEWADRWDRWIDVNGWTDGTGATGRQKRQIDRCEHVHRGDRWTDGMGG